MSQAVRERIPELAILKVLGFRDRTVMLLVLAEAFLLCFLGALSGMLSASFLTTRLPPEFPITTDSRVWVTAGVCVVLLSLLIGVPPALRALRIKIVDALAGR